ncbi:hypothetical protein EGM70_11150 [Enterobacteriaceae bacterium 89]|nr:hypothetical protein [Enterobacteriaceae bacterium 89]
MTDFIVHMLTGTPVWVYVLFVFLLIRGVKSRRPATVSLTRQAVIPLIFLVWDLYDLVKYRHLSPTIVAVWIGVLVVGAAVGYSLIRPERVRRGEEAGTILRQPDYSALPLMMTAFLIKYVFGVMAAVAPLTLARPGVGMASVAVGGLFAGSFIGKFTRYVQCYRQG